MKHLIIILLSLVGFALCGQDKRPHSKPNAEAEKPEVQRPQKPDKDHFGIWLDEKGFVKPGPKILNWIDTDKDKIDDRFQAGPGKPAGKRRPDDFKPAPKPEPKPDRPIKPSPFPEHWGNPPDRQTRDLVQLPGKFGKGSSTLADWIKNNLKRDKEEGNGKKPKPPRPTKPTRKDKESTGEKEKGKLERPERPARPEVPEELKTKVESYKEEKEALHQGLRKAIGDIQKIYSDKGGNKLTRGAVQRIIKTFNEENKERLEAQKTLAKEIKSGFEANRPERPPKPEVPEAVAGLRDAATEVGKKLQASKKALHTKLKEAKREDHREIIGQFKESQTALMNELKSIHKQIREEMDKGRNLAQFNKATEHRRPPRRPEHKEPQKHERRPTDGR